MNVESDLVAYELKDVDCFALAKVHSRLARQVGQARRVCVEMRVKNFGTTEVAVVEFAITVFHKDYVPGTLAGGNGCETFMGISLQELEEKAMEFIRKESGTDVQG